MSDEILKMVNITKKFGGITALDNVKFSCKKGEVHVLAGENGAGKSTLLKILAGIHKQDDGDIFFKDKKVNIKGPESSQKLGIAMVFQELTLIGEMSVIENIFLNQEPVHKFGIIDKKESVRILKETMQKYDIQVDMDSLVNNLSVAEQQMVEILKVLIKNPDLIILDEPTSALAKNEVKQLFRIIKNLTNDGKTVIFISHRLEELFKIGDRVTVFKDGHYIGTKEIKNLNQDELIKMMVGRPLENIFPLPLCEVEDKVVFSVKGLKDSNNKLNDISFDVKKGEILGIAGLQGHGQSELLNAISGIYPLIEGKIYINNEYVKIKDAAEAIKNGIALVPSDRKNQGLMLDLSIKHNLTISSIYKRLKGCLIDEKKEKIFTDNMVKQLSIKIGKVDDPVSSLSGGNQQKVVLGKELAIEPRVILFDEPTRGIDVEAKREFYQIMHQLVNNGVAVIMNSSDMMEVIGMSSRVIVMYEGKISGILNKDELTEERIMHYEMGLEYNKETAV